ncbi:hypothetical protein Salat_0592700 [Sesamum alatum]|uniref:FBD domain-containing protein n=1 Tax=Sesamum alatum TaxID=300844 RepID=A0AAE2CU70_9LAMI|nr:hypothetical protein Salat_0592700 [Sesamum alatum]
MVEMRLPPAFKGFNRLLRLNLESVRIAPSALKKLISKCPMLEYMDLYNLDCDIEEFDIDAPNLKSFSYFGSFYSICFKNASHLAKMSVSLGDINVLDYDMFEDYEIFDPYECDRNVIEVLGQLSSLESDSGFLQFLARGGVPRKFPINLNHLTDLCLSFLHFDRMAEVMCALCLIRSSPNLQSLKIISLETFGVNMKATQYLKAQQKHEIPLGCLKIVKICWFSGMEPEMEFVKLLLSAATVLRKLEINYVYAAETEKGSKTFKELLSFSRASAKAQIIFQDRCSIT